MREIPESRPRPRSRSSRRSTTRTRYADRRLAELLDALEERGALENAVVAVTADHGEAFGEHGDCFRGSNLYDELLRVPLVLVGPGLEPGAVRGNPVSLVGLRAVLLELGGAATDPGVDSESLLHPCQGQSCATCASTRWRRHDLASVLRWPFKLIRDRRDGFSRVFDLSRDPGEQHDLATEQAERGTAGPRTGARGVDPETVEALRALGYME